MEVSSTWSGGLDLQIVRLIDAGQHFGRNGSVATFKRKYIEYVLDDLEVGDHTYIMQYINVLYSAMTSAAKGSLLQKIRVPAFARACIIWADEVMSIDGILLDLDAGGVHVLMSVYVRRLQLLYKMRCANVQKNMHAHCCEKISETFVAIQKKAEKEKHQPHEDGVRSGIGPNKRLLLMAEGLLYNLHQDGMWDLPDHAEIKNRIMLAASYLASNGESRDDMQAAARLYRYVGESEQALEVARRAGNTDQMHKSHA